MAMQLNMDKYLYVFDCHQIKLGILKVWLASMKVTQLEREIVAPFLGPKAIESLYIDFITY